MLHSSYSEEVKFLLRKSGSTHQQNVNRNQNVLSTYDHLKSSLEAAHPATAEHSIRVRICATDLGAACHLQSHELTTLSIAAEFHDIGKLKAPVEVLDKVDPLTSEERALLQLHPEWGMCLASMAFPTMPQVAEAVLLHHERMDGSGYPYGFSGNKIPMLVRILSVADAFVAMTEDRPFRAGYSIEEAIDILTYDDKGKYDEYVVDVLRSLYLQPRLPLVA